MTQISKINGIPVVDIKVTGFTYDGTNTFTIVDNNTGSFAATMNSFSAATVSGGTFYGDGSNLTGTITSFTFSGDSGTVETVTDGENIIFSGINLNTISSVGNVITISGSTGGGSFTNFIMSDGTTTETIDDGNTMLFAGGSGLTAVVTATDTITYDLDITGTTVEATPASGDKLLLWDNVSKEHRNIDWDDLPGAGGGEINTASNVGGGDNLFKQKTGVDLEFRTLIGGTNLTISSGATTLTLNASGGGGGSSRTTGSTQTTDATPTTGNTINTITDDSTSVIEVFVKAYESAAAEYGVWKRTLTVTKVSGTVVIREVNADVDKTSTGLNANSIDFTVSGGDIGIEMTGIAATTIDWVTAWEIII